MIMRWKLCDIIAKYLYNRIKREKYILYDKLSVENVLHHRKNI